MQNERPRSDQKKWKVIGAVIVALFVGATVVAIAKVFINTGDVCGQDVSASDGSVVVDCGDSTTATTGLTDLTVVELVSEFDCDGKTKKVAEVRGFRPMEPVSYEFIPESGDKVESKADAHGVKELRWYCTPDTASSVQKIVVTAVDTERTIDVEFKMVAPPTTSGPRTT